MNAKSKRATDDRIVRDSIAHHMCRMHAAPWSLGPLELIESAQQQAADQCARHLVAGQLGLANAHARVHAQLGASLMRLIARRQAGKASRR